MAGYPGSRSEGPPSELVAIDLGHSPRVAPGLVPAGKIPSTSSHMEVIDGWPFDVADAYSADTAYYYEHVFDAGGDLLADVRDEFEWVEGRALFLHDVQVPRPLRRRGYGSLLAADAVLTLASHGTAVFAHPGPTDVQREDPEDVRRLRSETENTRFLAALGFVPLRDRLWALDLSAGEALDTLARIRSGVLA